MVHIKERCKQAKIYVGRSLTLHIFCFMLTDFMHELHFEVCQILCMVEPQNRKQKLTTKKRQGFVTIPLFQLFWNHSNHSAQSQKTLGM